MRKRALVAGVLLSVFSMGMSAQAAVSTTISNEGETELRRTDSLDRDTFIGDESTPAISIIGDNSKTITFSSDYEDSHFFISARDDINNKADVLWHDAGTTNFRGKALSMQSATGISENDGYRAIVNKKGTLNFENDILVYVNSNREAISNEGTMSISGNKTWISRVYESDIIPTVGTILNKANAEMFVNASDVVISSEDGIDGSKAPRGILLTNKGKFILNGENKFGNCALYGDIEHISGATTILNLRGSDKKYGFFQGEVKGSDDNFQLNLDNAEWILGKKQDDSVFNVSMKNNSKIEVTDNYIRDEAYTWSDNYKKLELWNFKNDGTGYIEISTDLANDMGDKVTITGNSEVDNLVVSIINKDDNNGVPIKESDGHSVEIVYVVGHNNINLTSGLSFYNTDNVLYVPIIKEKAYIDSKFDTEIGYGYNFVGWQAGGAKTLYKEKDQEPVEPWINHVELDNTLKRINDIRTDPSEVGVWLRGENGKMKIRSYGYKYNLMSGGYDWKYESDAAKMFLGFGISYAKNNCDTGIIGDTKSMGYNLYGSWLGRENNDYVDVIVKYGTLDKKYAGLDDNNVFVTGDYDKKLFSVAAKYGRRITRDDGWYYEPSVGLTWGRIGSADFTDSQGIKIHADSLTSKMATLGMQVGNNIQGTEFYGLFQVRHDFDGKMHVSVPGSDLPGSSVYDDMGGTWYKVGIGAARKINKNNSFYMDIEKDFGNKVKKPYAISAGYRYTF